MRQQQGFVGQVVDLVDQQNHRRIAGALQQAEHVLVAFGPFQRVDHEADYVHVGERRLGGVVHGPVEGPFLAGVDAGGVGEHDLIAGAAENAVDPVTGGLRLTGGDAHLLADQMVHQGGFAHIGAADDGHHAATGVAHADCSNQSRACSAACCSARRRLAPLAVNCRDRSGRLQATSKVCFGACPVTDSTS